MQAETSSIVWPGEFEPSCAPVHVVNRLHSQAEPALVWAWLVRASQWPAWYPNSSRVRIEGGAIDLEAGSHFRWRTFGVGLRSEVKEWVPGERIAWTARGIGVWAYHAWLIEPLAQGCTIVTEETQYGFLARLGQFLFSQRMSRGHQLWLENLDHQARGGSPG